MVNPSTFLLNLLSNPLDLSVVLENRESNPGRWASCFLGGRVEQMRPPSASRGGQAVRGSRSPASTISWYTKHTNVSVMNSLFSRQKLICLAEYFAAYILSQAGHTNSSVPGRSGTTSPGIYCLSLGSIRVCTWLDGDGEHDICSSGS